MASWKERAKAIPEVRQQHIAQEAKRILNAAHDADNAKLTAIGQGRALLADAKKHKMSDGLVRALEDLVTLGAEPKPREE